MRPSTNLQGAPIYVGTPSRGSAHIRIRRRLSESPQTVYKDCFDALVIFGDFLWQLFTLIQGFTVLVLQTGSRPKA